MRKYLFLSLLLAACNPARPTIDAPRDPPVRTVTQAAEFRVQRTAPAVADYELLDAPTPMPTASPTPKPTATPVPTHAPLIQAAMADCPVSLPNLTSPSPDEYYIRTVNGFVNPGNTIFTSLPWAGGTVIFSPNGPGRIARDGHLGMKWMWYRNIPGDVVIGGRRLDAPAPPMPEQVLRGKEDGYEETGFHPSTLVFNGEGCWEVTARVGDDSLTFVTLVIRLSFDPKWPRWIPEGMVDESPNLTDLPETIRFVYRSLEEVEARLIVETTQGAGEDLTGFSEASRREMTVQGQAGICVQGILDDPGEG
jgi:hypothetical protein